MGNTLILILYTPTFFVYVIRWRYPPGKYVTGVYLHLIDVLEHMFHDVNNTEYFLHRMICNET